jgi:hypothetical protein
MTVGDDNRFLSAFRRLALAHGLLPGTLQTGRRTDFLAMTAAATLVFVPGRDYSEAEVNTLLKDWLAGPGAMLATDHAEMRRLLIDFRLLERDGYGRRYTRRDAPEAWRAAIDALDGIDLGAESRAARDADAVRRAQRKASWTSRAAVPTRPR